MRIREKLKLVPKEKRVILDLCGGTGAWSRPYREAGYDVQVITLPEYDVMHWLPPAFVYGILAAPPCTEFSMATAGRKRYNPADERDFAAGMRTVSRCLEIIWYCNAHQPLAFWALENPRGYLRRFLGKPAFTFQPWWFGDLWTKETDLWGYFKIPRGKMKYHRHDLFGAKIDNNRMMRLGGCPSAVVKKATTPSGFAQAFFEANP